MSAQWKKFMRVDSRLLCTNVYGHEANDYKRYSYKFQHKLSAGFILCGLCLTPHVKCKIAREMNDQYGCEMDWTIRDTKRGVEVSYIFK